MSSNMRSVPDPDVYVRHVKGYICREIRTAAVYIIIWCVVLTSNSSMRRGVVSGSPLTERTDFGPTVAARQTHRCRTVAFTLQCSPAMNHYFSNVYYQVLSMEYGSSWKLE